MKLVSALILALNLAAPAMAADFADLQRMAAAGIPKVNPFPEPGNPDSCYLQGLKDGLCVFRCRSGETFQAKPVKPEASSVYEKCGGGDYRGADRQQVPDAGSIWNQINNQHNPFPQPQTTLDYCVFTEFKNNTCLFKCESGAILTEPAVKPDFSTGEPAGACATHIIRPIQAPFHNKAVAAAQTYQSYGRYPSFEKASSALNWALNNMKLAKIQVVSQKIVVFGLSDYRYEVVFNAAKTLAIEPSPSYRDEQDAYERMFDAADRLESRGAAVVFQEVRQDGPGSYSFSIGFFPGSHNKAADLKDANKTACFFNDMKGNTCVYKCTDGNTYTMPAQRPSPADEFQVACPQFVFPF